MKSIYVYVFVLISVLVSGCMGIHPFSDADKPCKIVHEIVYSNKNTRSEARHGLLFVNGNEVPDAFTFVACGDQGYRFYSRIHIWGSDGYFPLMNEEVKGFTTSEKIVGDDVLEKGYYLGSVRYSNIPASWIYVHFVGGTAFVDPDHIMDMLIDLSVPRLYREKRFPLPGTSGPDQ